MRDWGLGGFTTGSVSIAPDMSRLIWEACNRGDFAAATGLRDHFLPLEDLRDAWGPSVALHHAVELAGIAETGPIVPFLSPLSADRQQQLRPVAQALLEMNFAHR